MVEEKIDVFNNHSLDNVLNPNSVPNNVFCLDKYYTIGWFTSNMDSDQASVLPLSWDDPRMCPFCNESLASGGTGFIDHLDDSTVCQVGFDQWRDRIRQDMGGEWIK